MRITGRFFGRVSVFFTGDGFSFNLIPVGSRYVCARHWPEHMDRTMPAQVRTFKSRSAALSWIEGFA
jgi:hypothetical protein